MAPSSRAVIIDGLMWLWIIGILIVLATWVIWLLFPPAEPGATEILPLWAAITVTALVLGGLITLWIVRRVRAARAARALEQAIAQQAREEELAARPEDRQEIQALHRQISEGIQALKASRIAAGHRGDQALYALPWYAIVGPPGAGKTTALRHSGLQFPFLDPQGGGVRGVGGTRNCDWWFTNEAILLDTAGRYTSEGGDDRDEWLAFLDQLKKYRPEKPLNGVLVAISVSELLDASDDQVQQTGARIRARIDEMQKNLQMTLPVYVLFTKTDLVAGFAEFFGDMKKSDRGQMWGSTFDLATPKAEPARLFEAEFDLLVEKLHARVTKRINDEPKRTNREKIYQFPLEFAAIKRNLAEFMGAAFAPANGAQPMLRGFYFTSGTQEGRPLDRVVGAMGRAFGLKGSTNEESDGVKEGKSYFLRDVFLKVVFADQSLAALSDSELRRRRLQKLAVAGAATLLAVAFAFPAIFSFANNRRLVLDTERVSQAAANVNWKDGTSSAQKVQKLDELRSHLEMLKEWKDNGHPISYSWSMYQGERLFQPLVDQYIASLRQGFVDPSKARLEDKVDAIKGDPYLQDYNNLKSYLLLDDREHLKDPEIEKFQVSRLTQTWSEVLLPTSELAEADLKAKLFPHVQFFVRLQRDGVIPGVPREARRIEGARERLRAADPVKAYYELFVIARIDEKIDDTQPSTRENLKYPPLSLDSLFEDRPEVLGDNGVLSSKRLKFEGKYAEVRGPYTVDGFKTIDKLLSDEGAKLLEREAWVVPYSRDEKLQGDNIKKSLRRVRQRYEDDYISEWREFFRDIDVKIPVANAEAIREFRILSTPEWAYRRLLQTLSDNTQFVDTTKPQLPATVAGQGGVIDQVQKRVERRFEAQSGVKLDELKAARDVTSQERIKRVFESTVGFGVASATPPPAPKDQSGNPLPTKPPPDPALGKYVTHLETLASEMQIIEEGPPDSDPKKATELFTAAVKESEAMLLGLDKTGQELLEPLLMNPLRQGYRAYMRGAGGAASGLWEVMVWPHYRDKIKDRYPFNLSARRDASFEDAVAFFRPKTGVLWGFYEKYLSGMHRKQDHQYVPIAHLQGKIARGKPYTPFSPLLYNCLERADEITDALWSGGDGELPNVQFQINLKTVSPIVSHVVFEIDGQRREYRNEKEFFYEFKWPGTEARGARIQVRGAGGLDEEIVREGPWGVFRLFESADKFTAVKDSDQEFLVTWTMSAPPVSVTMQVRPRRGNHPFPLSFFRSTNCPSSIGDRFGGGDKGGKSADAAFKP